MYPIYCVFIWITTFFISHFLCTPGASLVAQLVKNLPVMRETWVGKIPWRRERLPIPIFWSGEFHGLYSPRGHKELDTTERLHFIYTSDLICVFHNYLFFFNNFIYLLLASLGLHCFVWPFSLCGEWGYSSLQCPGFSLKWFLLLQSTGSRHMGVSSCSMQAW